MDIAWLDIADSPQLWRAIGFEVDDAGRCIIGSVEHRLVGPDPDGRRGIVGWSVSGIDPATTSIDGLPTSVVDAYEPPPAPKHPNHVFRIDHLVLRTSNTPRTAEAIADVGLDRRGGRATNSAGDEVDMTFFWAGDTLLELAGPRIPKDDDRPASFAGIAYATADLDATVSLLGDRSTTPVDAVQPGRRIAALTEETGSTIPMAFMTPHVRTH